ncbi:Hypothetical predicted protein [Lecanosticta acicola]|uniref:Uncharacterized protein n=1 Tax=Lecanosticta acicola TaxID=111012 RepID=A0AAI8YY18_9PEZI|nr:Hypothetical predicted protein [Lecanosticta acicola]
MAAELEKIPPEEKKPANFATLPAEILSIIYTHLTHSTDHEEYEDYRSYISSAQITPRIYEIALDAWFTNFVFEIDIPSRGSTVIPPTYARNPLFYFRKHTWECDGDEFWNSTFVKYVKHLHLTVVIGRAREKKVEVLISKIGELVQGMGNLKEVTLKERKVPKNLVAKLREGVTRLAEGKPGLVVHAGEEVDEQQRRAFLALFQRHAL